MALLILSLLRHGLLTGVLLALLVLNLEAVYRCVLAVRGFLRRRRSRTIWRVEYGKPYVY